MAEEVWTIVVGGGSGNRYGALKQFEPLGDRRVIDHSRDVAAAVSDGVVVVVPSEALDDERPHGALLVAGGATRSASVRNGLAAVPASATIVCVHDAARPLATREMYARVIDAVATGAAGAIPVVPVTDTIKVVAGGTVVETPDRSALVAVQTPQAFRSEVLRAAHAAGGEASDDAALVEALGCSVVAVEGDVANRKITLPEDLDWARRRLSAATTSPDAPADHDGDRREHA